MKTIFAVIVGLTVALLDCRAADTNSLIGDWQTDEVLSQFGPSVTSYSFATNGTFTLSTKFTQGVIPPMSVAGSYQVISNATSLTNQLVTVAKGRTNTASCYFQGSTLVIDEGRLSKIFRLKRKP